MWEKWDRQWVATCHLSADATDILFITLGLPPFFTSNNLFLPFLWTFLFRYVTIISNSIIFTPKPACLHGFLFIHVKNTIKAQSLWVFLDFFLLCLLQQPICKALLTLHLKYHFCPLSFHSKTNNINTNFKYLKSYQSFLTSLFSGPFSPNTPD